MNLFSDFKILKTNVVLISDTNIKQVSIKQQIKSIKNTFFILK